MTYRVIQWYTGAIAREQIRMLEDKPEAELVGAVVHHKEKSGIDLGEITKGPAMGITTVGNIDDGLAIDADVVLYNAPFERYDEIIRILESGKNVITPSAAFYPSIRPELSELEAACRKGGVSLLGTGVNPGFAGDVLPLVASSLCARVDHVHIQEVGELSGWDPFMLTEVMKFGKEVEELEKDAVRLKNKLAQARAADLIANAREVKGIKVVAAKVEGLDRTQMRALADTLRNQLGSGVVVLGGTANGNVALISAVTKDLAGKKIHAGKLVGAVAAAVGGRGGGRPDLAEAGGKNSGALPAALEKVYELVSQMT